MSLEECKGSKINATETSFGESTVTGTNVTNIKD